MRRASIFLVAGLAVYAMIFGMLYATRVEMMPHHDAVIPDDIEGSVLPLYYALMRLAGAAAVALGAACLYLALGPVSRGDKVAAIITPLCLAGFFGATAFAAAHLERTTGVSTHWVVMAGLALLALIALALDLLSRAKAGD